MVDQFVKHTPASPTAMDHHSILETRFLKHAEKSVSSNVKLETEMRRFFYLSRIFALLLSVLDEILLLHKILIVQVI